MGKNKKKCQTYRGPYLNAFTFSYEPHRLSDSFAWALFSNPEIRFLFRIHLTFWVIAQTFRVIKRSLREVSVRYHEFQRNEYLYPEIYRLVTNTSWETRNWALDRQSMTNTHRNRGRYRPGSNYCRGLALSWAARAEKPLNRCRARPDGKRIYVHASRGFAVRETEIPSMHIVTGRRHGSVSHHWNTTCPLLRIVDGGRCVRRGRVLKRGGFKYYGGGGGVGKTGTLLFWRFVNGSFWSRNRLEFTLFTT